MKLLLDTTYLLPTIGISIKEVQKDALTRLAVEGYEIAISEISLFELSAKAAKLVINGRLPSEYITSGIRALLNDDFIAKIPIYNTKVLSTAFTLKHLMVDFIDCLILSTALNYCDMLISEDTVIANLNQDPKYIELLSTLNPKFKCKTFSNFIKKADA